MNVWQFFDFATCALLPQTYSGPLAMLARNTPAGCGAVAGEHDHLSHRVALDVIDDYGDIVPRVVEWQPPPPADDEWQTWFWDAAARRWVSQPTLEAHWREVRLKRAELLEACDWVVARATEQGEPVPQVWRAYRQALRDITLQPDPLAIVWPPAP